MNNDWLLKCAKCENVLEHEITENNVYRVEVICRNCGWHVIPFDIPILDDTDCPYSDVEMVWETPKKYRQSRADRVWDGICVVKPLYAKKLVDNWMQNKANPLNFPMPFSFDEALSKAVGCPAYVLAYANVPMEYLTKDEAKEVYPQFFNGRF